MRSTLLLPMASLALVACSDATGGVQGGEPLAVDPCTASLASGSGHRWQDLYACYFGPNGKASCASQGVCHGTPGEVGAQFSSFVCGLSKDACWQGVMTLIPMTPGQPITDGRETPLYNALRKQDGTATPTMNNMPCSPVPAGDGGAVTCSLSAVKTYTFTPDDLARIVAWIQDGAQNN